MSLSVIIITYNEERNISRCLESLNGIADEIVVVDSYSTDNTEQICLKYDVRFIQRKFEGYGDQKRFATEQARFDYILSLDADEELSEALKKSINAEKRNWLHACYSFNRKNFYCNKPIRFCGWYPDRQIRLFNRQFTNWTKRDVHESIELTDRMDVMQLKGDLLHYTCTTMAEHVEKEKKYARINAEILTKKGRSIFLLTPFMKGAFRFFKTYIIKFGILDGYYGFVISKTLAKSSFLKYSWARKTIKTRV